MNRILRVVPLFAGTVIAAALVSTLAYAEALDATQWRFTITFPCPSQLDSQVVKTAIGDVVMTSYVCTSGNNAYFAAINDYPAGTVTPNNSDTVYAGVVNGEAENSKGTLRNVAPFTLGTVTGREAVLDMTEPKGVIRSRQFLLGDRLYQVMCVEADMQDASKTCLDFLDSFTLLPAK